MSAILLMTEGRTEGIVNPNKKNWSMREQCVEGLSVLTTWFYEGWSVAWGFQNNRMRNYNRHAYIPWIPSVKGRNTVRNYTVCMCDLN